MKDENGDEKRSGGDCSMSDACSSEKKEEHAQQLLRRPRK
jgi:hypothetical protein